MTDRHPASRRRRWTLVAVTLGLGAVALAGGACSALRAGRLLRDALDPPADLADRIVTEVHTVRTRAGRVEVLLLRPADDLGPLPGIVLVHGAVDAGARERRFTAFARSFAARGMVVAAPQLDSLARFGLDAEDPTRVADVARWLASEVPHVSDGAVALAGISVGGSYALIAADDDAAREHVRAVLSFGAYADLDALLLRWMTAPRGRPGALFDPLTEGRRLVLLGNVDHLVEDAQRVEVRRRLRAILDGHAADGPPLPAAAAEVVAVAQSTEPLEPERARALLRRLGDAPRRLSPAPNVAPSALVHLLHGAGDPVVPADEMDALEAALRARGVTVRTHRTELFDHVDATSRPGLIDAWPLLRFVGCFLDDAGL